VGNDTPAVSVTICCYNSERWIADTIQSVLDQTYRDFEIVAVNDGSQDRTEAIIKGFSDPRIRYFPQENRGLSPSRNRSIQLARGEFVAFLDHDDLWHPEKLSRQMAVFQEQPDVGMVFCDSFFLDAEGPRDVTYVGQYDPASVPMRGRILDSLLEHGCFIPLLAVVARRSVLLEVGEFNAALQIIEDYDMWIRIAARYPVEYVPEVLCSYRVHESMASRAKEHLLYAELLDLLGVWQDRPEVSEHVVPKLHSRRADLRRRLADVYLTRGQYRDFFSTWREATHYDPSAAFWIVTLSRTWKRLQILRSALGSRAVSEWPEVMRTLWQRYRTRLPGK
jgi:glycosyltransferase involved in cell wall biosynthesis